MISLLGDFKQINCSEVDMLLKDTLNVVISKVNDIEAKLQSATPTNSAMDAISLAKEFLESNPYDVDTRVVVSDFVKFVREKQHQ